MGAVAAAAPFVADADPPDRADIEREEYGLLTEVAIAAGGEEAERIEARLGAVGIRATTTVGRDGRHRVLVFATEIHRARRSPEAPDRVSRLLSPPKSRTIGVKGGNAMMVRFCGP